MPIEGYKKAERKGTTVLVSVAGGTQSGKTYTAMRIARGLTRGEPFFLEDTENKRGLHYAAEFDFEHFDLRPPFSPKRYLPPILEARDRGFKCVVMDSFSHEWQGEGGVLEMADKSTRRPPSNWIQPKEDHQKLVNGLLQAGIHLVICLRAKQKMIPYTDEKGKQAYRQGDWSAITEKDFVYEMTTSLTFSQNAPGIVDLSLPHKIQDQHRLIFPPGQQITELAGEKLADWCDGKDVGRPDAELYREARNIAQTGTKNLTVYVNSLDDDKKFQIQVIKLELWGAAKRADQNMGSSDEVEQTQSDSEPVTADPSAPDASENSGLFGDAPEETREGFPQ